MQLTQVYRSDAIASAEAAMRRMDPSGVEFLATQQDISRYVESLLTEKEQQACDMATD